MRLWGTRTYRPPERGGCDYFRIVTKGIPLLTIRLYGFGLNRVGGLPVNLGDRDEVDACFSARLPEVVSEGDFSKPRYADEAGKQRDPELRGT